MFRLRAVDPETRQTCTVDDCTTFAQAIVLMQVYAHFSPWLERRLRKEKGKPSQWIRHTLKHL